MEGGKPKWPQEVPGWPPERPKWPQNGPKRIPRGSKIATTGPKMAPRKPKMAPTGPRTPPGQRLAFFFAPLGPPKGPQEPLKLDTWDPQKVTTVTRILHFFTFEAMSRQESKVGRLKDGGEGLLGSLIPVLWVPNRPCGGGERGRTSPWEGGRWKLLLF